MPLDLNLFDLGEDEDLSKRYSFLTPSAEQPAQSEQAELPKDLSQVFSFLTPSKPSADREVTGASSDLVERIAKATRMTESGGDYNVTAKDTGHGAYQFMPDTWADWSKQFAGKILPMTPENQDAVAKWKIQSWLDEGLTPPQIALKWNSGGLTHKKGVNKWNVPYDTHDHVNRFMDNYNKLGDTYAASAEVATPAPTASKMKYKKQPSVDDLMLAMGIDPLAEIAPPEQEEGPLPEDLSQAFPFLKPSATTAPEEEGPLPEDLSQAFPFLKPSPAPKGVLETAVDAVTNWADQRTESINQSLQQQEALPVNVGIMGEPNQIEQPGENRPFVRQPIPMPESSSVPEAAALPVESAPMIRQPMPQAPQQPVTPTTTDPDQLFYENLTQITPEERQRYMNPETNYAGAIKESAKQASSALIQAPWRVLEHALPGTEIGQGAGKTADWLQKHYESVVETDEDVARYEQSASKGKLTTGEKVVGNLGSTAASVLVGAGGMAAGAPAAGLFLANLVNASSNIEETRSVVRNALMDTGVDAESADARAADLSHSAGSLKTALDSIGLSALMKTFKPASQLVGWALDYVGSIGTESFTEGLQGVTDTVTALWATKPKEMGVRDFAAALWKHRGELVQSFAEDAKIAAGTTALIGGAGGISVIEQNAKLQSIREAMYGDTAQRVRDQYESGLREMGFDDDEIAAMYQETTARTPDATTAPTQEQPNVEASMDLGQGTPVPKHDPETIRKWADEKPTPLGAELSSSVMTDSTPVGTQHVYGDLLQALRTKDATTYDNIFDDVVHNYGRNAVEDWLRPMQIGAKLSGNYKELMESGMSMRDIMASMRESMEFATTMYYKNMEPLFQELATRDLSLLSNEAQKAYQNTEWFQAIAPSFDQSAATTNPLDPVLDKNLFTERAADPEQIRTPEQGRVDTVDTSPSMAIEVLGPFADTEQRAWAARLQADPENAEILSDAESVGFDDSDVAVIKTRLKENVGKVSTDAEFLDLFDTVVRTYKVDPDPVPVFDNVMRLREEGLRRGLSESVLDQHIEQIEAEYDAALEAAIGPERFESIKKARQSVMYGKGSTRDLAVLLYVVREQTGLPPRAAYKPDGDLKGRLGLRGVFEPMEWMRGQQQPKVFTRVLTPDEKTGKIKNTNRFRTDQAGYIRTMGHEIGHLWHTVEHSLIQMAQQNPDLAKEMFEHSLKWNPFTPDPFTAEGAAFLQYRMKPQELVADTVSALLLDPEFLQTTAPSAKAAIELLINASDRTNSQALQELAARFPSLPITADFTKGLKGLKEIYATVRQMQADEVEAAKMISDQMEADIRESHRVDAEARKKGQEIPWWKGTMNAFLSAMLEQHQAAYKLINKKDQTLAQRAMTEELKYKITEDAYARDTVQLYAFGIGKALADLAKAGVSVVTAEKFLINERIAFDEGRKSVPNQYFGISQYAKEWNALMKKEYGAEKAKAIDKFVKTYQQNRLNTILREAREVELFSPKQQAALEKNNWYVTFDKLNTELSEDILYKQRGSFSVMKAPLVATFHKDLLIHYATQRTKMAQITARVLDSMAPEAIKRPELNDKGKYVLDEPKGWHVVNYKHLGKDKSFATPNELARWNKHEPLAYEAVLKVVDNTLGFMKQMLVSKNVSWMGRNFIKDYNGTLKKLPGYHPLHLMAMYAEANPEIKDFLFGEKNGRKRAKNNPVMSVDLQRMYENKMIVPGRMITSSSFEGTDEAAIYEQLRRFGVGFEDAQANAKATAGIMSTLGNYLKSHTWDALERRGEQTEKVAKLAGFKYILSTPSVAAEILKAPVSALPRDKTGRIDFDNLSEMEKLRISYYVREHVGTPDVMRRGSAFHIYNNIKMFSNINAQDWRSTIEVARSRPIEYALKSLVHSIIPRTIMFMMKTGMFRFPWDDDESVRTRAERINSLSAELRYNYLAMPVTGVDVGTGKALTLVFPEAPSDQFIGALYANMLDVAYEKYTNDPTASVGDMAGVFKTVVQNLPYIQGNVATGLFRAGYDWFSGVNHIDDWTQMPVVPNTIWTADNGERDLIMAKYMWNKVFSGYYRFDTKYLPTKESELEKFLSYSGVRQSLGTFLRVSGSGLQQQAREIYVDKTRDAARSKMGVDRLILDYVQQGIKEEKPPAAMAAKAYGQALREKLIEPDKTFNQFKQQFQRIASGWEHNPLMDIVINAPSIDAKVDSLLFVEKQMSPQVAAQIRRRLVLEGYLKRDALEAYYLKRNKKK